MIKVCIVTWYYGSNYGTVLQAYALNKAIQDMGYETAMLDSFFHVSINCLRDYVYIVEKINQKINQKILKIKDGTLKKNCCSVNSLESKINNQKMIRIKDFVDKNHNFTKVSNKKELLMLNDKYNVFITGSDQIWNPNFFTRSCMLDFVNDKNKKISYSSSIGVSKISRHYTKVYKKLLSRFSSIAVREKTACNLLSKILGKKIGLVLDPVFLLDKEEWEKIALKSKFENKTKYSDSDYLLYYFVGEKKDYWNEVKKISKDVNCEIRVIPLNAKVDYERKECIKEGIGIEDFLWLIMHAKMICTDSFHMTAFSIIMNKKMCVFRRFANIERTSQNSRIDDLLDLFSMRKCYYNDFDINCEINYDLINMKLNKYRDISKKYLYNAINGEEDLTKWTL